MLKSSENEAGIGMSRSTEAPRAARQKSEVKMTGIRL
jgi:hypothetical protein